MYIPTSAISSFLTTDWDLITIISGIIGVVVVLFIAIAINKFKAKKQSKNEQLQREKEYEALDRETLDFSDICYNWDCY